MVCLLAFLLYTGTNLQQKDRFVITSLEYEETSYHSYEVNYETLFPVPAKDSGIYRTLVKFDGPGTYLTVYCSIKLSINDLQGAVSKGLTRTQARLDRGFSNDERVEDGCLDYVNNLDLERREIVKKVGIQDTKGIEPGSFIVSQLILSHQCTMRILISLAYQQRILCAGSYGFTPTYRDARLPTIEFDEPLKIAATVLDGQMIIRQTVLIREEALGWS
ncbi:BgTH12-05254 [Blumeria graminis f. sp. triticale]|uniref:BgTH12-05254 n=1 Tax=Blumeria graminis f. sp. triticale TaxID=1689686 RepID=A0A9W4DJ16_BLUGR|nr:BgTH12-05254 [Blumeria graminis f. sp. triticale]